MWPTGMAHISRPRAAGPRPASSAYGAASASGATTNSAGSQKSSIMARTRRLAKTARAPLSDAPNRAPPRSPEDRAGRSRVPNRSRAAEQRNVPAVMVIAPRAESAASSTPPTPKPVIRALCETIRSKERPRTNSSPSPRMSVSAAIRVPVKTGATEATRQRSARSAPTGVPGSTMNATQAAQIRSLVTSTRRAG